MYLRERKWIDREREGGRERETGRSTALGELMTYVLT